MNHQQAEARERLTAAAFGRHCEHRVQVRAGDLHDALDVIRELEVCCQSLTRELAAAKTELLARAVVVPVTTQPAAATPAIVTGPEAGS